MYSRQFSQFVEKNHSLWLACSSILAALAGLAALALWETNLAATQRKDLEEESSCFPLKPRESYLQIMLKMMEIQLHLPAILKSSYFLVSPQSKVQHKENSARLLSSS